MSATDQFASMLAQQTGPLPSFDNALKMLEEPLRPTTGSAISDAFMNLGLVHPSYRFVFVAGTGFVLMSALRPTWMAEPGAPGAKWVVGLPLVLGVVAGAFF